MNMFMMNINIKFYEIPLLAVSTSEAPPGYFLAKVFIIFGALLFAKQLPDLISSILGVKLSGGFTLNPLKKLGASPYAAGAMGLLGGAVGGMAANAWAIGKKWKGQGFKGTMKNVGSVLAGGGSAGFRGMYSGLTSGGKGSLFSGAASGIKASSNARNLRDTGFGLGDKISDKAHNLAGIKKSTGTTSSLKNEVNDLQQRLANVKMNEQNNASALQHRLSEQRGYTEGLMNTFNWAYETNADGSYRKDDNGNLIYETKTWEGYGEAAGRAEAEIVARANGTTIDWDSLSDQAKADYIQMAADSGAIVQREVFDELNGLYQGRIAADTEGKLLEKQIKSLQEDMDSFKNRGKTNQ